MHDMLCHVVHGQTQARASIQPMSRSIDTRYGAVSGPGVFVFKRDDHHFAVGA